MAFFSLQLADSPKFLEIRIEKNDKIKRFSKYLFQAFRDFAFKLLFYSFDLPNQPIYKFFFFLDDIEVASTTTTTLEMLRWKRNFVRSPHAKH